MYSALSQASRGMFHHRQFTSQAAWKCALAGFDQLKCKLYRQELKGSAAGLFTSLID